MDTLNVLAYGGIAVLVVLLAVFEIKDGRIGAGRTPRNNAYEFYTSNGDCIRIRKVFGSLYKVYVYDNCPVQTKKDRFGTYFTVRAYSASEAESIINDIYR